MLFEWDDLNEHDRADITKQIYSQEFRGQFEENMDCHEKEPVEVAHRLAQIDIRLAGIIRRSWQNGWETTACCQDITIGDKHYGYIQFLSSDRGGNAFAERLGEEEIDFRKEDRERQANFRFGEETKKVQLRLVNYLFRTEDIKAIDTAIASDGL